MDAFLEGRSPRTIFEVLKGEPDGCNCGNLIKAGDSNVKSGP
jgi:hypothetical protein